MSVDNIVRFVEECSNRPDFYLEFPHTYHYDYRLFLQFSKVRDGLYCSENKQDIGSTIKVLYNTLVIDMDRKNFWHYEKRDSH